MVDFKAFMSVPQRAYYERIDAEITRLFNLPTRFLSRALIVHARAARARHPDFLALKKQGNGTISSLIWDIIPEISYRLGERSEVPGERSSYVRAMSDADFRILAGHYIMETANIIFNDVKRPRDARDIDPLEVLTHEVANGNPVAFALDRLVPALSFNREDALCRHTKEVSENRGFRPPYLMWSPDMRNYRHLENCLFSNII